MTVVVDACVAFAVITVVTTGMTLVVDACIAVTVITVVVPGRIVVAFAGTEEERELMEAAREELEKYVVLVFVDTNSMVLVFVEATVVALEFALPLAATTVPEAVELSAVVMAYVTVAIAV